MSESGVHGIAEFHTRLFSATENGKLLGALRQLSRLDDSSQLTSGAVAFDGWSVWYASADEAAAVPA